jgi:hypothetical protein
VATHQRRDIVYVYHVKYQHAFPFDFGEFVPLTVDRVGISKYVSTVVSHFVQFAKGFCPHERNERMECRCGNGCHHGVRQFVQTGHGTLKASVETHQRYGKRFYQQSDGVAYLQERAFPFFPRRASVTCAVAPKTYRSDEIIATAPAQLSDRRRQRGEIVYDLIDASSVVETGYDLDIFFGNPGQRSVGFDRRSEMYDKCRHVFPHVFFHPPDGICSMFQVFGIGSVYVNQP